MKFLLAWDYDSYEIEEVGDFPTNRRKAIETSIQKWNTIIQSIELTERYVKSGGIKTCALCNLYYNTENSTAYHCADCPVYQKTGKEGCEGTPEEKYSDSQNESRKVALRHAKAEVAFLQKLL